MARREELCRPRRAVPVPAGTGEQQGRHRHRPDARRLRAARWRPGSASRCRRRSRWCCSPTASTLWGDALGSGWLHGLKVVAVAVVAQAVLGMMRTLAPDRERATLAVVAAAIVLAFPTAWGQVGAILLGGLVGLLSAAGRRTERSRDDAASGQPYRWRLPRSCCSSSLLIGLPLLVAAIPNHSLQLFDAFYRAGSLVFGGGHVVLPLLQAAVVPPGWVSNDVFLAGYGAAQAVPGPLFTFSAYLGTVMGPTPNGVAGAALCLVAMFLPSFLLVIGAAAVLGRPARATLGAVGAARRQRRRRRPAARRALQSGVDGRHPQWRRLRARRRRVPAAVHVADAALAGGGVERDRRRRAGGVGLSVGLACLCVRRALHHRPTRSN